MMSVVPFLIEVMGFASAVMLLAATIPVSRKALLMPLVHNLSGDRK